MSTSEDDSIAGERRAGDGDGAVAGYQRAREATIHDSQLGGDLLLALGRGGDALVGAGQAGQRRDFPRLECRGHRRYGEQRGSGE